MKKIAFIFLLHLILLSNLFAIKTDSISTNPLNHDTNYIISRKFWIQAKAIAISRQAGIRLTNTKEDENLDFNTNNPFAYGFAVDYSWITLEYTQTIKGYELTNDKKGNSEYQALSIGLNGRKFFGGAFYRYTKGFYLGNIEDWDPDWFSDHFAYPNSQDLETKILAFSLYYTFNHRRFSNSAPIRQNERQIKSAGSPVLGVQANIERIHAKTPLLYNDSLLGKFLNISQTQYVKAGIVGGYMHTFSIMKRIYFHAALTQGFLYSRGTGNYHNTDETELISALGLSFLARSTIGYNGKRWYGGTLFTYETFLSDVTADLTSSTNYSSLKLFIGYRFPIKRKAWMKKFYL